jgi:hypothetical protein
VVALGVAWVLDGLEITIASNVGPDLTSPSMLHMSASGVADIATRYLIGEFIGALFFAIAQCFGSLGSNQYGHLIGDGKDPNSLYWGYLLGAGAMIPRRRPDRQRLVP